MRLAVWVTGLALLALAAASCEGDGARSRALDMTTARPAESPRLSTLPVSYCLDLRRPGYADDASFARLVARAFEAWGVPAQSKGRCDGTMREGDGRNQIGWGVTAGPAAEGPGVYEAGLTRVRVRPCPRRCPPGSDGELVEADIVIDPEAPRPFRTERCLYSVLLHEVGHFMGLGHLDPPAVMELASSRCRQDLTTADVGAMRQRYGDDLMGD